jgi:hypothetical protein
VAGVLQCSCHPSCRLCVTPRMTAAGAFALEIPLARWGLWGTAEELPLFALPYLGESRGLWLASSEKGTLRRRRAWGHPVVVLQMPQMPTRLCNFV